jgi:hypothetical protein
MKALPAYPSLVNISRGTEHGEGSKAQGDLVGAGVAR